LGADKGINVRATYLTHCNRLTKPVRACRPQPAMIYEVVQQFCTNKWKGIVLDNDTVNKITIP